MGEQGDSALPYYRQRIPGAGLARRGWKVTFAPILVERHDHRLVGWRGAPYPYGPVAKVVVVRHLVDPTGVEADSAPMFAAAHKAGQLVFYDLDDDLWQLPEDNPAARHYTRENLAVLEENLRWCHGVLASTPELAAEIAKHTATPVHVCPNGLDVSDWPRPHEAHRPLRVGWTGMTRWRARDLRMIRDALADALAGRPVEFWHIGAGASGGRPVERILGPEWPTPVKTVDWSHFSSYGQQLANLDCAVVPMVDEAVNRSRSPSTGLALAACGIPFVASPLPAYVELARAGLCWTASTAENWTRLVGELVDRVASAPGWLNYDARERVARLYGPAVVAGAWHEAFTAAIRTRAAPVGR